jgi:hypothetical protein
VIRRLTCGAAALAALLAPAWINGFPFVFADTGGYLARPFEHALTLGRSALYGLLLASGIQLDFWPIIIVQGLIVLWLVRLALRTHTILHGVGTFSFTAAILVMLTSLPWYAGMLMPDIFVLIAVLAFYLLAFSHQRLRRMEQALLVVLVGFAMSSHMSIVALVGALMVVFAVVKLFAARLALPSPHFTRAAGAATLGIAISVLSNLAITGQLRLTPGGSTFFFARLLQDGIISRYLADHCPDPEIRLCAFRAELPQDSDEWLWGNSPLEKLGGWEAFESEARRIIIRSMLAYPWQHARTAIAATVEQFFKVATGEGFHARDNWHAEGMFRRYAPDAVARFTASRQQHDAFKFEFLNAIHVPVALLTAMLLPVFSVQFRHIRPQLAALAITVFFALLANAAICGIVSNPNPRYQSRIAPLAVLVTLIILVDRIRSTADQANAASPPFIEQNPSS